MIRARLLFVAVCMCGCGDGGAGPSDAAKDVTVADAPAIDVSLPDVNAFELRDPACDVPAEGGSGACITVGDGGSACNPVTGTPCALDAGETCDYQGNGFHCYAPPPANTAAVCNACDNANGPACAPGNTCVPVADGSACARFCCVDSECGGGHCDVPAGEAVGICVH